MLDSLKKRITGDKTGFSVAEMLIVLLILSFLILALPPLVHKKVEKRVTRGDHGRYECWRDPDTGELMEFYATEKAGADPKYLDAAGNPIGAPAEGGQCKFNPEEMAPNAAYFSFQAVGGGSGGTYPPYDPSDTTYKNDNYKEMAEVKFNTQCCKDMGNTAKITKEGACDNGDKSNTQTCTGDWGTYCKESNDNDPTLEIASCPNYVVSLNKLVQDADKNAWLKRYWKPVKALTNLKICSSRGYTGMPTTEEQMIAGSTGGYTRRIYYYGGPGGDGVCYEVPSTEISLDENTKIQVVYSKRKMPEKAFGKYDYGKKVLTLTNGRFPSYEKILDPAVHHPNPTPMLDLGYDPITHRQPETVCGSAESPYTMSIDTCVDQSYKANYISANIQQNGSEIVPMCTLSPGENGVPGSTSISNEDMQTKPEYKGASSTSQCDTPWVFSGYYSEDTALVEMPTFPATVKYERFYGFDTPTFGYSGSPGEAISMFLPKLDKNLTFEIGDGGEEGQAGNIKGGNGSDTIVYSDGVEILRASGGLGLSTGEAGSKVFMFGEDVFTGKAAGDDQVAVNAICEVSINKDDPTSWPIAGCLDKGVARDNKKRFAENSDFYAVLELDAESTTPSAINYLYGGLGQNLLPGSGGDGGYTFLRSTTGTERLVITNDSTVDNENSWERDYEYINNQPYTCYKANDQFDHPTGEVINAPDAVCKPTKGYPGAVVIVW